MPDPSKTSQRMASLEGSGFSARAVSRINEHLLADQSKSSESIKKQTNKQTNKQHPTCISRGKNEENGLANKIVKIQVTDGRNVMIY